MYVLHSVLLIAKTVRARHPNLGTLRPLVSKYTVCTHTSTSHLTASLFLPFRSELAMEQV